MQEMRTMAEPLNHDVLPVILGGDIGAYSLARAFHEAYGIVSLVLSQADCHMCGDSSILVNRVVPHLERREVMLSALADVAECFGHRTLILLGCGDWYVRAIVESRAVLEASFTIPYIGEDLLNQLTDKERFYELCGQVGVPVPRTVVFDAGDDAADPDRIDVPFPFPVVAKPAVSATYHYADFPGKEKVFFPRDADELKRVLNVVQASRYDGAFLVQETIPGDDTYMRILTTYSDRAGKVRFAAFGQTLLEDMRPMGVGNPLAIVSRTDEQIVAEATRLLEAVGYTGFANFDIKVDPRDGSHVFFEVNTRLGRSNYYVTAAGCNVAQLLVEDLVEERPFPDGVQIVRGRESLYTVVPKRILLDYIEDVALRREIQGLYALGCDADPLDYPAEKHLRRRLYPLVFAARQWKTCRAAMEAKRERERRGAQAAQANSSDTPRPLAAEGASREAAGAAAGPASAPNPAAPTTLIASDDMRCARVAS
ncbi:hypothetical protein VJ923_00330 [Adlercreutzia sp. R25]|uniref:ATP-grasp domain-containing protein n=1 Tax=Adlercreutzia shanghongiae TaxID=3111773 RepID=A0ABU6J0U0_9ACTN|nr:MULTISPECIES: hypothetical protein [unclassified Adlercreutzia]MEC4271602.1 hypothetical protein [Adlercreutzia sp. R25]MEC4295759.1 hypothetical protein [Adlercreutzia sp. R22]